MARILVVEDDKNLVNIIKDSLKSENHTVDTALEGNIALEFLNQYEYDLVVLDWELPGLQGPEICKKFRDEGGRSSVIFLTGKSELNDKKTGFSVGADDYLTKPFEMAELNMRVNALLRRPKIAPADVLEVGSLSLNRQSGIVRRVGEEIKLQPREIALLEFLMRHPNTLFSQDALLERVWEADAEVTSIALRSCIAKLRRKLDKPGQESIIESVRGMGYRLNVKMGQ